MIGRVRSKSKRTDMFGRMEDGVREDGVREAERRRRAWRKPLSSCFWKIDKGRRESEKRRRVIDIEDGDQEAGTLSLKIGSHEREMGENWEGNSGKKTKLTSAAQLSSRRVASSPPAATAGINATCLKLAAITSLSLSLKHSQFFFLSPSISSPTPLKNQQQLQILTLTDNTMA
ncbi:hypothetical protein LINPERPRIM_LOCUS12485 [Linum perenne]